MLKPEAVLESVYSTGLKTFAHWHFSVQVDRAGVAKFVSKANTFLPPQVLAMLNSMHPAEKSFCVVSYPLKQVSSED